MVAMKTTFDLPDDLVREMKLRAVMQRRTLRDLAADFIRQGLGLSVAASEPVPPRGSQVQIGADGIPFFPCNANAPASEMTIEELLALEQEAQTSEDLQRAGIAA
jgi:hypothetical protein